ncbi:MAG: hypothetical protein HN757_14300 [Calditrichaeota bacterium]|nr:hypothetical protein [Calditrichota bacterium]
MVHRLHSVGQAFLFVNPAKRDTISSCNTSRIGIPACPFREVGNISTIEKHPQFQQGVESAFGG